MTKRKYRLSIGVTKEGELRPETVELIEADSLVELCSKIPLTIVQIQEALAQNDRLAEMFKDSPLSDDDIPF